MILSSGLAKSAAALAALALHGALLWAFAPQEVAQIAGGGVQVQARLGNSFADLAQGRLTAQLPTETAAPPLTPRAQTAQPVPAARATGPTARAGRPAAPVAAPPAPLSANPVKPEETAAPPADHTTALVPRPAPLAQRPDAPGAAQTAPSPATPARAEEPTPEIHTADAPETADPARSLRPRARSAAVEQRAAQEQARQAAKKPERRAAPAPTPRGNADTNSRAGASRSTGTSARAGAGQPRRKADGNAAAANYPGQVLAKLRRIGTLRLGVRGAVKVTFTVSAGGGLASLGIARSSGSARLDRAALDAIRRAAPFPAPPPGARRSFSLTLTGT